MRVCRFLPPFPAQYLLALPFALVKDEKTEFCEVFSRKVDAPSAGVIALWRLEPMEFLYSKRGEQFLVEIIDHLLSCYLAYDD